MTFEPTFKQQEKIGLLALFTKTLEKYLLIWLWLSGRGMLGSGARVDKEGRQEHCRHVRGLCGQARSVLLALTLTSGATLGKSLYLSDPQSPFM